ncbi:MAG: beta-ketoacyl synthase N-terminal-like domain-containing protein [Opitutaceae bacterium]
MNSQQKRRVVVTGMGAVTPLGDDLNTIFNRLYSGQTAINQISRFDPSNYAIKWAGEINGFDPEKFGIEASDSAFLDNVQQFGLAAVEMAVLDSGLDLPRQHVRKNTGRIAASPRIGTAIGTSNTSLRPIQEAALKIEAGKPRGISPHTLNKSRPCSTAALASIRYGLAGPILSQNSASATGAVNIISAVDTIRLGRTDVMIAGGTDSGVSEITTAVFGQNLSGSRTGVMRPFDRNRDGVLLGEGG